MNNRPAPFAKALVLGLSLAAAAHAAGRGKDAPDAMERAYRAQKDPAPAARPSAKAPGNRSNPTHLKLRVRLHKDGRAEVQEAVELEGERRPAGFFRGPYVTTAYLGNEEVAVESHPDPFELRAYGTGESEHGVIPAEEGTITVVIPAANLQEKAVENLDIVVDRVEDAREIRAGDPGAVKEIIRKHKTARWGDLDRDGWKRKLKSLRESRRGR